MVGNKLDTKYLYSVRISSCSRPLLQEEKKLKTFKSNKVDFKNFIVCEDHSDSKKGTF